MGDLANEFWTDYHNNELKKDDMIQERIYPKLARIFDKIKDEEQRKQMVSLSLRGYFDDLIQAMVHMYG